MASESHSPVSKAGTEWELSEKNLRFEKGVFVTNDGKLESPAASQNKWLGKRSSTPTDAEDCAVCLETKADNDNITTILPCKHTFHSQCCDDYFKNCFVKECPICRGTIEGVQKGDNKVLVTADKLRAEFKQSCYSVRFKKVSHLVLVDPFEPPIEINSFFTNSEEIRSEALEEVTTRDGTKGYAFYIPNLIIELVDSTGEPQVTHSEAISISTLHSEQYGDVSISPDTALMHNGIAILRNVEVKCENPGVVAMKFVVQAPGLLVHHTAVYGAINFHIAEPWWWGKSCLRLAIFIIAVLVTISLIAVLSGVA